MLIIFRNIVACFLFSLIFICCQESPNKKAIEGAWVMESMTMGDYNAFGAQLGSPEYVFHHHDRYEIDIAGSIDKGHWVLNKDTVLTMKSATYPKKVAQTLYIRKLTDTEMVYKSINDDGQVIIVKLIRL